MYRPDHLLRQANQEPTPVKPELQATSKPKLLHRIYLSILFIDKCNPHDYVPNCITIRNSDELKQDLQNEVPKLDNVTKNRFIYNSVPGILIT